MSVENPLNTFLVSANRWIIRPSNGEVAMLSAAASRTRPSRLDSFQLALSLLAKDRQATNELKTYLAKVLAQANALLHNPRETVDQLPEAIELAFEMQQLQELRRTVETILDTANLDQVAATNLDQVAAQKLLKQLEQYNAGQERPRADRILP
jgi:hypothetical protein